MIKWLNNIFVLLAIIGLLGFILCALIAPWNNHSWIVKVGFNSVVLILIAFLGKIISLVIEDFSL